MHPSIHTPEEGRPRKSLRPGALLSAALALCVVASALIVHGQAAQARSITILGKTGRPVPSGHQLTITPASPTVKLGQRVQLVVKNTGSKAYRYWFPGGRNGCVFPIYRISVIAPNGKRYVTWNDSPRRLCTMAIVPGRWIVLQPGQTMSFGFHTGRYLYAPWGPGQRRLRMFTPIPGKYRIEIRGGGLVLSTSVTVVR